MKDTAELHIGNCRIQHFLKLFLMEQPGQVASPSQSGKTCCAKHPFNTQRELCSYVLNMHTQTQIWNQSHTNTPSSPY